MTPTWLAERMAAIEAAEAAHAASCVARWCSRCGRHACIDCGDVAVARWRDRCVECTVVDAIDAIGIPSRYRDACGSTASRVTSHDARRLAAASLDAPARILTGPPGSGKSTLLAASAQHVVRLAIEAGRRPPRVVWASAIELGESRAQHRLGDGEASYVRRAIGADILALDDLGAESARESEAVASVIHRRHDAGRGVWVSTGLTRDEIGTRYGGGIERRIYERAVIIDCTGGG